MPTVASVVLYRQPSLLRGGGLSKGIAPKNTRLLYPDVECLLRRELCELPPWPAGRHRACYLEQGHIECTPSPKNLLLWVTGQSTQMPDSGIHSSHHLEKNRRGMMPDDATPDPFRASQRMRRPRWQGCFLALHDNPGPCPALPLLSPLPTTVSLKTLAYKCFCATGSRWTSATTLPSVKSTRPCWP